MRAFCRHFWKCEQGQDLVEYLLLLAFVVMAAAGVFLDAGGSMNQIWTKVHDDRCILLNSKNLWQPNKSK